MQHIKFISSANQNGIYALLHKGKLQYIGKSVSILSRIPQHTGKFPFDEAIVMPVIDLWDSTHRIERQLIDIYQPPYNRQGTAGNRKELSIQERLNEVINEYDQEWQKDALYSDEHGVNGWLLYHPLPIPKAEDIDAVFRTIRSYETRSSLAPCLYTESEVGDAL